MQRIESLFSLLLEEVSVYQEWRRLVFQYRVSGVQVHDCYIAAAMQAHNITHLLTFNTSDFARYTNIAVVDPATV